jgi:NAD(P)-dependent dehydrogenase (short-subunit alcohol dehydrogenase family)
MMRLKEKAILVTGAGAGIGKGIAQAFAAEGAKVVVNDLNKETGNAVAKSIVENGGIASFVQGDTSKTADAQNMVKFAVDTYGTLDVLLNNAGVEIVKPLHEMTEDEWDSLMGVNLKGYFLLIKHSIPQMVAQGKGNIINLASAAALLGFPLLGAYCASKHGVYGLTRSLCLEVRQYNIRVNAICPAVIETDLGNRFVEAYKNFGVPVEEALANLQGRIGTVEEVTGAAVYLASDESSFVNGIALPIDGGATAA